MASRIALLAFVVATAAGCSFVVHEDDVVFPTCSDEVENGGESDVDCGGGCSPCAAGRGCARDGDCVSGNCSNEVCAASGPNDAGEGGADAGDTGDAGVDGGDVPDASESDAGEWLDAGASDSGAGDAGDPADAGDSADAGPGDAGGCATRCGPGERCVGGTCVCVNDCGGFCAECCSDQDCDSGQVCGASWRCGCKDSTLVLCDGACVQCCDGSHCASGLCVAGACRPPACDDGVRNGTESDVDCGGGCTACRPNQACNLSSDCVGLAACLGGRCATPAGWHEWAHWTLRAKTASDYRVDQNAVVADLATGLMWQWSGATLVDWTGARSTCDSSTVGGYSDWRLPTAIELVSIVDYGRTVPLIDTSVFSVPSGLTDPGSRAAYWSSTGAYAELANALEVEFRTGLVQPIAKSTSNYVRCVR